MMNRVQRTILVCMATVSLGVSAAGRAGAALTYYYDPDTGTVAIDTAGTRSGGVYIFGLRLNPQASEIRFRTEEHLRLTNTTYFESRETQVAEGSLSTNIIGYYSIGEVLPSGLSEETWLNLFDDENYPCCYNSADQGFGHDFYTDVVGGGKPPEADFVYGLPNAEFDNRLDLIDPDSLTWAEQATLVYHAANGKVDLVTNGAEGGYITGYILQSVGEFMPEHYKAPLTVPFSQANESVIGLFADLIEPGKYKLGKILEKGMAPEEFEAVFTKATFAGRAGFGSTNFDFETQGLPFAIQYVAVPEPTSVTMLSILLIGSVLVRRRSRRN